MDTKIRWSEDVGTAQFDIVDVTILTYLFALSFDMSNRAHQLTIIDFI